MINQDNTQLDVFKLKCIGILLCDGLPEERAIELYDLAQPA